MRIEPFLPSHLACLLLQPQQAGMRALMVGDYGDFLAKGDAFTALDGERILGCGGLIAMWEGRALLWALLAADIGGAHMLAIHRATARFLEMSAVRRIEATCDCEFAAAHRWLRLLGFTLEAERMRGYRPDGGDEALYARIR